MPTAGETARWWGVDQIAKELPISAAATIAAARDIQLDGPLVAAIEWAWRAVGYVS